MKVDGKPNILKLVVYFLANIGKVLLRKGPSRFWLPISCSQQNNTASSTSIMAIKKANSFPLIFMAGLQCALKQISVKPRTTIFRINGNTY